MPLRKAYHAGSWYSSDGKLTDVIISSVRVDFNAVVTGSSLNGELERWLRQATSSHAPARAIIAPYPSDLLAF